MKLKTLIAIPIVIMTLAYIGVKVFIYYKVKTELDEAILHATPIVQINYGGIGSDLNGMISIENVLVTPTGSYDEIRIQEVTISGNGPRFLFDLARGFKSTEPPEQLSIRFDRLESPLSTSFLRSLATNLGNKGKLPWKEEADICSMASILRGSGLKELGFPGITIDGGLGYTYSKDEGNIEFKFHYELYGVESSNISFELSGLTAAGVVGLGTMPSIERISVFREMDPGYVKQMITMCSGNAGKSPDEFIDSVVSRSDRHFLKTLGFIPGPGIKEMFKQLLTAPGLLEIRSEPSSTINPAQLAAYKPSDMVDLLGINVSYNSVPITDLSFKTKINSEPKKRTISSSSGSRAPLNIQSAVPKKTPKKKRRRMRYIPADIDELSDYLLYRVRIYTVDNAKPKQGVLISIENSTVNVEEHLYNGKMTVHLHTSRIDRVEVLRRSN